MRKHDKLVQETDLFLCYKWLNKENALKGKTREEKRKLEARYERELIALLKKPQWEIDSLEDFIERLEKTNPFLNGYQYRTNFKQLIENRKSLKHQKKVENSFGYVIDNKKGNSLETMIQRHLMLSGQYQDILGIPVFYEFPCNLADKKHGKIPIDLITYQPKEKTLCLIELKKCRGNINCMQGNLSESKELFLRALLEITTYYSFFIHLLERYPNEVISALKAVGNLETLEIKEIKKVILGPKRLFNDVYTEELLSEMRKVECYTIEIMQDDISKLPVKSKDRIFEIKKYEQNDRT